MKSHRTLKRWYNKINKKFFLNELTSKVCVRYVAEEDDDEEENCEEKYKGWAERTTDRYHDYTIVICPVQDRISNLATLVHEMIHVSTCCRDDHGKAFEMKRQMLSDRGLFKKNAIYRGYTLF